MWFSFLIFLWLAAATNPGDLAAPAGPIVLPIEVLGDAGTIVNRTFRISREHTRSCRFLWLQIHGVRYRQQASLEINQSEWIPLRNDSVIVADPGRGFGGIGGGFATLEVSVPIPPGALVSGDNTIRFRFNESDGLASGFRVLAMNLLTKDGERVLAPTAFVEDTPDFWKPPAAGDDSIRVGKELWRSAELVSNSLPNSRRIQAHCADCHAHDGRDLKYFNFSNASIIARSRFHGLTTQQGEQIASYIRSLPFPNPGRPWNPPYQPGPGLDSKPVTDWAAGAGLSWLLKKDVDALPFLLGVHRQPGDFSSGDLSSGSPAGIPAATELLPQISPNQISPDIFRPDGNLDAREIPIALELPDWSQWLPRIHPKDAWGPAFTRSHFCAMYDGAAGETSVKIKPSLRSMLHSGAQSTEAALAIVPMLNRWQRARRTFLGRYIHSKTKWSPELTEKVYSTQLWQLTKTWEMTQEFELEGRASRLLGQNAEPRMWCNTIPAETAPDRTHIQNGPAGVGGSALTNEYLSASWYELQILLNSGNHKHRDRGPVDWVYLIGHFHKLYNLSHEPEPVRLLVAVTKGWQSTDPHLGPDDFRSGWRPDQSVDPRIMVIPSWQPLFHPLPSSVRRALTEALLTAWMDKNVEYPAAKYLPLPSLQHDYQIRGLYPDFSGGHAWDAAEQFRAAGVSKEIVDRLQDWGSAYTDRAARLQYR